MDKVNDRRQWIVDELNCFNTTPSWIGSNKQGIQCLLTQGAGILQMLCYKTNGKLIELWMHLGGC